MISIDPTCIYRNGWDNVPIKNVIERFISGLQIFDTFTCTEFYLIQFSKANTYYGVIGKECSYDTHSIANHILQHIPTTMTTMENTSNYDFLVH